MSNVHRLLALLLAVLLLLTACGGADQPATEPAVPTEAATEAPTEAPTEPPVSYDYAVYPDVLDFIVGDADEALSHLWGEDTVNFEPGAAEGGLDRLISLHPYNWSTWTFEPELKDKVWEYVALLEEDPFNFELIHRRDLGTKWIYIFRYTGSHPVYSMEVSGFVPEDGGSYQLCIAINDDPAITNQIGLEIASGYGLEAIDRETCARILAGEEYIRTSAWVEEFVEPEEYLDYRCTYCDTPLTGDEVARKGNDEIVYCDNCYRERFGGAESQPSDP